MKPHELPALTVYDDHLPLPNDQAHPCAELHAGDLLAEPPAKHGEWVAGVVRRIIAMSTGPVAVGIRRADYRSRLEAAGLFCANEDADLAEARAACWPGLATLRRLGIGAGNPRPALVVVGQATTKSGQIPFASRGGTWLFAALRRLGYDELSLYVTNAYSASKHRRTKQLGQLRRQFESCEAAWLAVGNESQRVLESAGIPHAKACSPAYHKQFKHSEGIDGYAKRLREGGLEPGRWQADSGKLSANEVPSLPELRPPYDIRSVAFVRGKTGAAEGKAKAGSRSRPLGPQKREAARRAFVTGEAPTLQSAAEMVGCHVQRIYEAARNENWKAEREEYQRAVTERAKEAGAESEAKAMADCRRDAWKANALALAKLVRQLQKDGDVKPSEAEAINRIALSLSAAGVGAINPEHEALASKPLAELAKLTLEHLDKLGGGSA